MKDNVFSGTVSVRYFNIMCAAWFALGIIVASYLNLAYYEGSEAHLLDKIEKLKAYNRAHCGES